MCGICGQYSYDGRHPVRPETIKKMASSITHRGPDDDGFYFEDTLGLGFRRLSIIDLAGGHQPMSDAEESVQVVFNGEIYNFPELKQELEADGYHFRTRSDTEVIVHGYKKWGTDVFNHLNGMFGLAIWDVRRKRLVLARDAFGIKLIYYKLSDGVVSFGSEIRAVRSADSAKPNLDATALSLFLRYRFTPSPYTIYQDVRKLAAGTMLVAEAGSVRVERWYRFKPVPFEVMPSAEEAQEELLSIYRRAVKRHLLSDVPVGLLLSGGLDSGLLLGLMNERGTRWPTFTIGYGSKFKDDELVDAAETASIFGADHTSIEIDRPMFEKALPHIVSCVEEPVAASSIVPMYFVSQRARQSVKVALNGQGPDELFGGYKRHLGVRYGGAWASLPDWLRGSLAFGIKHLPRAETLRRGTYSLSVADRLRRYQSVFSIGSEGEIEGLFQDGVLEPGAGDRIQDCWADIVPLMEHTDELGGFQFLEMRSSLPDELLMYADKLSMAHSLEVRVPYLDREVVEYVERLNASFKVRHATQKWLHRRVCRQFLPEKLLQRKKRGFAVNVVDDWFRSSNETEGGRVLQDRSSKIYEFLRPQAVERLLSEHRSAKRDHHKLLFSLQVFETLLREREMEAVAV